MTAKKATKKKAVGKAGKVDTDVDNADTVDKTGKGDKNVNAVDSVDKADKDINNADTVDKAGKGGGVLAGRELVDAVVSVLEEKLAERITVIDLRKVAAAADWFVVCSGDNTSHTTAVASGLIAALKERHKTAPWHHEGVEDGRWALIDYTDVVVHVMLEDVRKYYDLESLWR